VRAASDEATGRGSQLLAKYYEDHPELGEGSVAQAMNDFNVVRVAVNAEVEERVRPVIDRFDRQLQAQQRLIAWARFASPAILMQDLLNDISGTGTERHRHFMAQVSAFHDAWRRHFVPLIFRRTELENFAQLPQFRYQQEPFAQMAGRTYVSLAGLLLPGGVLGIVGLRALRRCRVAASPMFA
jgi:ABC-2 type transport system permease protein